MPPPDGQQPVQPLGPGFELQSNSGRGLLDGRALWAAEVGRERLAMARTATFSLSLTDSVCITKNLGASDAYVFVGVSLPASAGVGLFMPVWLSREESLGDNSAPFFLTSVMGKLGGGVGVTGGFTQLLLPGEQLYAQMAPGGPLATGQRVVVAAVVL
jgi:hypothetical protein